MEESWTLSDRLTRDVASLAKNLVELSGDAPGTFESELGYIWTVHKDLRGTLEAVKTELVRVASECLVTLDITALDLSVEYHPGVTDRLDSLFERIDTLLDVFYGRKSAEKITVATVKSKRRKFLELEQDPQKIVSVPGQDIFVPSQHPFEREIRGLYLKPTDLPDAGQVFVAESDMERFPFQWIDTPEALTRASIELEQEKCIAVDLENHSFHTYYGFLCLMQISTLRCDYVIDIIRLREYVGSLLRNIFADSDIIKVFHGAQSDIQWLQRDFNIFVVNMFDTFFAAKALQLAAYGLSHLLQKYCGVTADKKYQLADWRTRPIPEEMLKYARMDTHYLLNIYGTLCQELRQKGGDHLVLAIFQQSTLSALSLYKPESWDPQGWRSIVGKSSVPYSEREVSIIKAIYAWREKIAKEENESPPAVMPNYMILRIAQGPSTDPQIIFKLAKHPMTVAMKHVESLKEAILNREFSQVQVTRVTPGPTAPTHTKFPDTDSESDSKPHIPAAIPLPIDKDPTAIRVTASCLRPLDPPRVRVSMAPAVKGTVTMAGMFGTHCKSVAIDQERADNVVRGMAIVKASEAAKIITQSSLTEHASCDEAEMSTVVDPIVKEQVQDNMVTILKSNQKYDAEEFLRTRETTKDHKIPLFSRTLNHGKARIEPGVELELVSRSQELLDNVFLEKRTKRSHVAVDEKRQPAAVSKPPALPPRIGNAPRSGNKSMTFVPRPNK